MRTLVIAFAIGLCSKLAVTAHAQDPGKRDVADRFGPPGYATAPQELEAAEREIMQPFLASRALGDELVRETKLPNGHTRSIIDISNWHDPKWNDDAEKFLRNWNRLRAGMPDALSEAELHVQGWKLIDAGCREPMIVYANAWLLDKLGKDHSARHWMLHALSGLQFSQYTLHQRAAAEGRYGYMLVRAGMAKAAEVHFRGAATRMLESIKAGERKDRPRELVSSIVAYLCDETIPLDVAESCMKELEGIESLDRCTLHTALGEFNIRRAWEHRGSGVARTVTEEGWQGFHKHLKLASAHLQKAWSLEPRRPEAPASMITVCMAGHAPEGTNELVWLERAMYGQIDYRPAFDKALSALQPRWGGSHDAILEIGAMCANMERYDTDLPLVFIGAVSMIYNDRMHPAPQVIDIPEVYDLMSKTIEKTAAHPNHRAKRAWLQSVQIALAHQAGKHQDVRRLTAAMSGELDPFGLRCFRTGIDDIKRVAGPTRVTSAADN